MKKTLLSVVASMFISAFAYADTVSITSVTDMISPAQPGAISSTSAFPFVGTKVITFKVVGKTCNFVGSATAIGPQGCNYGLTVNNSTQTLSNPTSGGNSGCTPTSQMLAACK